jgi:RimJ/RimL family protein N-acetyltransferase
MGGHLIVSNESVGHWVAEKLGSGYFASRSNAIGLMKDNKLIAGVIYENWNRRSIMCHIAVEGRLTRLYVGAIFNYAFNVCNVEKIIVPVESHNLKSIKLIENMGFTEEGRIKDSQPNGDIILYTMAKGDCRFLGDRYG